jgi:hypothetical protein
MYNSLINRIANFLPLYPAVILVSLVFSMVFIYGWYINITFAKPKISEAIWGVYEESSTASNSSRSIPPLVKGNTPRQDEVSPILNRKKSGSLVVLLKYIFTVDLSTVTTLLLTVTSISITAGFLRIYRFKKKTLTKESEATDKTLREQCNKLRTSSFPFWSTYKHTFIYLGLLGTLFAFIIAFSQAQREVSLLNNPSIQAETMKETFGEDISGSADILLFALGTALWSSFSAITLSLLPINSFFRHFFIQRVIPAKIIDGESDEEIDEVMDRLTEKAKQTESSFEALARTSDNLARNMNQATINSALNQLEFLHDEFKGLRKNLISRETFESSINEIDGTLRASMTTTNNEVETLKKDLVDLTRRLDDMEKQSEENMRSNAEHIRELRNNITDIVSRLKNLFS